MAAADQQFLDALKYLGQQGQEYGIKKQMDSVNERAEAIRSTMTNEIDRRQALRALAQEASISVSGSGGNANQQAAISNLIPPMPTSVQSAYLQGSLTGDTQMVGVAKEMQDRDEAQQLRLLQRKATFEMMLQEKKESGKNDPERLMILKENRKKLDDLRTGKQKAIETIARLRGINGDLAKGVFIDTGPIDGRLPTMFASTQDLERRMNELSLDTMVTMFQGLSRSIDTETDRKKFESSQLSMTNHPEVNQNRVKEQMKILQNIVRKANIAEGNFKMTGGLSFDASDDVPIERGTGYQTLPPAGAAKPFFTPKSGK